MSPPSPRQGDPSRHGALEEHARLLVLLALGAVLVAVISKALLLPNDSVTLLQFSQYLVRLALVSAADVCFLAVLGLSCWFAPLLLDRRFRVAGIWRLLALTLFLAAAGYQVFSIRVFQLTSEIVSYRLLAFHGDTGEMAAAVWELATWPWIAAVIGTPLAVAAVAAMNLDAAWVGRLVRMRRVVTGTLLTVVIMYGAAARSYVDRVWVEPDRWERRISRNPHSVFVASVLDEWLLQDVSFSAGGEPAALGSELREADVSPAASAAPQQRPRNVVLLVLASVGAGDTSLYGSRHHATPGLLRLAESRGMVFDNAYTCCPDSCKNLFSLVSGVYPRCDAAAIVEQESSPGVPAVHDVLSPAGFRCCFAHSGYWNWRNRDRFLSSGVEPALIDAEGLDAKPVSSWGVSDRAMLSAALDWIDERPTQPFFLTAWTIETRPPFVAPDDGPDFDETNPEKNRYLKALSAADAHVVWLVEQLKQRGLDQSTLLVVTADHGRTPANAGKWISGYQAYEPRTRVPLVLIHPSLKPRRIKSVASQIDVAPTILGRLGIRPPRAWQGRDLLGDSLEGEAFFFALEPRVVLGLRQGRHKYHYYVNSGFEELFDLSADPGERSNLAADHESLCRRLRRQVRGFVNRQRRRHP